MTALEYVQRYRSVGINPLPIRSDGSKAPALREWKHLQNRVMTDEEVVANFSNGNGIAAIGGAISGHLEDFDFDDVEIFQQWKELIIEHLGQEFWNTLLIVKTPRPGFAVITRCRDGVEKSQKLAWARNPRFPNPGEPEFVSTIETKGEGGYCLLPGSPTTCHKTGRPYTIIQGSFRQIPELTAEQREIFLTCARSFDEKPRTEHTSYEARRRGNDLLPGDDFSLRVSWKEILTAHGYRFDHQRGDTSYWTRPGKEHGVSASTNHGGFDLFYTFSTNCYPFNSQEGYSKFRVYTFLNHGGDFKAAARELGRQGYGTSIEREERKAIQADQAEIGEDAFDDDHDDDDHHVDLPEEVRPAAYSDDALADQFSARYEHELRYVPSWGWLEWTGQRWKRISDVLVMERARPICRSVAQLCREDEDLKPSTREGLARSLTSAKTVAAVERLARGDRRHYSEVHQWDADAWLFNTPGGTIDLRTGELRPHQREDLITKIANATPRGDCPKWIAFLERVTNRIPELQAYLQRLAGYALVGDPREECLDFFYGSGGNGKGTYLASLEHVFGEYATTAGAETFMESKGDKHPCDVAKLAAARLVISNEIDENQRWDEARIKNLTGRDMMTARFMRQDFFDFLPQFTLIIAGNHKPTLKTVDESIRRRFHLVPFNVTIPTGEQNTNLKAELRAEADGILAWAVAGCLEWQRQRLNPPEIVLTATADYLQGEDTFEMWLSECCVRRPDLEERIAYLYESFRRWKQDRGEQAPGQKTFTTRLTERGFIRDRDMYGYKMLGLRLNPEERKVTEAAINERRASEGKQEWWNR